MVLNGPEADCFVVSARTGAAEKGSSSGISLFFISKDAPGLRLKNYKTYDGRSASELQLDNVAVTAQALVGELNNGFAIATPVFSRAMLAVCPCPCPSDMAMDIQRSYGRRDIDGHHVFLT